MGPWPRSRASGYADTGSLVCWSIWLQMKWFLPAFRLFSVSVVWPQVKTGTVIYIDLAKDEFTFAADSRTNSSGGGHEDTECKILAFGNYFVFSMAGAVKGEKWDAHAIA